MFFFLKQIIKQYFGERVCVCVLTEKKVWKDIDQNINTHMCTVMMLKVG